MSARPALISAPAAARVPRNWLSVEFHLSILTKKINFDGHADCGRGRIWQQASFRRIDLSSSFKDQSKILQGDLHLVGSALISLRFPYLSIFAICVRLRNLFASRLFSL